MSWPTAKILRGGGALTAAARDDWMSILSRLSAVLLRSDDFRGELTEAALLSGWCGQPAAPEVEIAAAERRLGVALPPSYRSFLSVSNGWRPFDNFIERLLPVHQVERFRLVDPERVGLIQKCYTEDDLPDSDYLDYETPKNVEAMRHRYYPECLVVGKPWLSESDIVLLNPHIISPDGEWEAIFFANWIPGNQRYRSFRDLVAYRVQLDEQLRAGRTDCDQAHG